MRAQFALAALVAAALIAVPALAADPSEAGRTLPAICKSSAGGMQMQTPPAAPMKMDMGSMDKAHQDLMKGMPAMDANMNEGMMASDADMAFDFGDDGAHSALNSGIWDNKT